MAPFIVCTISRSRTRWLAELLTYRDWKCHSEVAMGMREIDDIARFFRRPRIGTTETAVAPGWELLRHLVPDIRAVVVRRPIKDAIESMRAAMDGVAEIDVEMLRGFMVKGARALDRMARDRDVLTVEFADLGREDVCAAVFEHCLPYDMPHAHWAALNDRNIQFDMKTLLGYYNLHRGEIAAFKAACRDELRWLIRSGMVTRAVSV